MGMAFDVHLAGEGHVIPARAEIHLKVLPTEREEAGEPLDNGNF